MISSMASISRRRATRRFQTRADDMKIAKTDSAVTRNPNSKFEVLTGWLVDMSVADGEGSGVDMGDDVQPL